MDDKQSFDIIIGHIEDLVISEEFQNIQENFFLMNYEEFDNTDENKIIYTEIFNNYTLSIEQFIIKKLNQKIENFDMDKFILELQKNKSNLEGEIFELLFSLTDFLQFKEMILDYKAFKEGKFVNLSQGITVTRIQKTDEELSLKHI